MIKKSYLTERAHILTAVLLIIQPLLDVISYWFQEFNLSSNITLVLRLGVLAVTVVCAFIISDRKRIYWIAAAIIVFIYAGHLFACWQAAQADAKIVFGFSTIIADFSNYVRVIQMPVTVICLITFLRSNSRSFEGIQFGMCSALLIICAVMFISHITGTDPHTYKFGEEESRGILGWFNNTNSQSSNLCVLLPISLVWQMTWKKRRPILFWGTCILGLLAMYHFCTRLAYLGIIAITAGIALVIFIIRRTDWKYGVVLIALTILFGALIPISPMTRHLNANNSAQSQRQEWLNASIKDPNEVKELLDEKDESDKELTEEEKEEIDKKVEEQLEDVYMHYIPDFVEIFGLRETMEMYDYTTDVNQFSALRAKKLMFAQMLMNDSPVSSSIFGLDINRFTVGENIYDVENDFHGIFYLYGWAGLAVYLAFIAYFIYLICWALIKNIKKYFTIEAASFGIALVLCLAHAYNTAGVLRRPNASIYLSAILAGVYYLVRLKKYDDTEEIPSPKKKRGKLSRS